ncbi:hypothetical protein N007_11945 [Alicyclobacillus acidoterrestris ATCC 49025]|nr:hypothetical protein N007_11945 [Alicyclobacillus acidoterrestris ATCC 49025]
MASLVAAVEVAQEAQVVELSFYMLRCPLKSQGLST